MSRILGREGVNSWISGNFLKAVIQEVILFGLETWLVTPQVFRILGGVHHSVYHCYMGKQTWRLPDGGRGPAQFLKKFKNQPKITKLGIIVKLAV